MMCGGVCWLPGGVGSRKCLRVYVDHSKALEQPHRTVFKGEQFSVGNLMLPDVVMSVLFPLCPSMLCSLFSASSAESSPWELRGHLIQFPPFSDATREQRGRCLELLETLGRYCENLGPPWPLCGTSCLDHLLLLALALPWEQVFCIHLLSTALYSGKQFCDVLGKHVRGLSSVN